MIELILTVCALSAPSQCDEQRLQFASQESLMQCTMQAPPYIAQWSNEHPATRVRGGDALIPATRIRREDPCIARLPVAGLIAGGAARSAYRSPMRRKASPMRLMQVSLALALAIAPICAADAQDAMRGLDLTSPDMTTAEMTRAQVEAALKAAPVGAQRRFHR